MSLHFEKFILDNLGQLYLNLQYCSIITLHNCSMDLSEPTFLPPRFRIPSTKSTHANVMSLLFQILS